MLGCYLYFQSDVYSCQYCKEFTTTYKEVLKVHINAKHTKKIKYNCEICDFESHHDKAVKRHVKTVHEGKKPHYGWIKCDYCPYEDVRRNVEDHINAIHTKIIEYKCENCDHKTFCRQSLRLHANLHNDSKTFNCAYPECEYKTKHKRVLKEHVNFKHEQSEIYSCDICDFETYVKSSLRRHFRVAHEKRITKNFACPKCDFVTNSRTRLQNHINGNHTKNILYKCEQCVYATFHSESLKTHINTRHKLNREVFRLELVSKESNHLAAILYVYAEGLNFVKKKKIII